MRFPANIPERYDPNGIWNIDYKDELAAALTFGDATYVPETAIRTVLMQ